jgi:hypothetical protein
MSGLYSAVAEQGTAAQWQDTAAALAHVAAIISQAANDRQLKESQLSAINKFIASETRTESQSSQQAYSEVDATSSAVSCELPQDCLNAGRAGKIYREIADMIDGERIDAVQMWTKVDDDGNTVRRLAKDALNEGIVICDDYNRDVFYDTCVEYVLAEISADITTPLYSIRDSIRRWNKVFRDTYPEGTTQYAPIGAVSGSNCRHQPALTGTGTASTVKSPSVSKPVEEDKPMDPVGPEDHDDVK